MARKPAPPEPPDDDWAQDPGDVTDPDGAALAAEAAEAGADPRTGEVMPRQRVQPSPKATEVATVSEQGAAGSAVAVRKSDTGLWRKLAADVAIDDTNPELLHRRMIEQFLFAETPEEILTPADLSAIRDVVDEPLRVVSFTHHESEFEAGSPLYMNVTCRKISDNSPVLINTGIQVIMGQIQGLSMIERRNHARAIGAEFKPLIVRDYTFGTQPEIKAVETGISKRFGSKLYRLVFP